MSVESGVRSQGPSKAPLGGITSGSFPLTASDSAAQTVTAPKMPVTMHLRTEAAESRSSDLRVAQAAAQRHQRSSPGSRPGAGVFAGMALQGRSTSRRSRRAEGQHLRQVSGRMATALTTATWMAREGTRHVWIEGRGFSCCTEGGRGRGGGYRRAAVEGPGQGLARAVACHGREDAVVVWSLEESNGQRAEGWQPSSKAEASEESEGVEGLTRRGRPWGRAQAGADRSDQQVADDDEVGDEEPEAREHQRGADEDGAGAAHVGLDEGPVGGVAPLPRHPAECQRNAAMRGCVETET